MHSSSWSIQATHINNVVKIITHLVICGSHCLSRFMFIIHIDPSGEEILYFLIRFNLDCGKGLFNFQHLPLPLSPLSAYRTLIKPLSISWRETRDECGKLCWIVKENTINNNPHNNDWTLRGKKPVVSTANRLTMIVKLSYYYNDFCCLCAQMMMIMTIRVWSAAIWSLSGNPIFRKSKWNEKSLITKTYFLYVNRYP